MPKAAERAGTANVGELVRQGRIKYNGTRGLDQNPNPEEGMVLNPESGMRAGLTPEKYHSMVLLSERKRRLGKEWDFCPQLEDYEMDIYLSWLKSGGPKALRSSGRETARSQTLDVMKLLNEHDPDGAAEIASIPLHPRIQKREAIGSSTVEQAVPSTIENGDTPEGYTPVEDSDDDGIPEVVGNRRGPKKKNP